MSAPQRGPDPAGSTTEKNLEYAASLILNVFSMYDVDKGGTLQRRELRQFLRQCGAKLSEKQCNDIIDQLDTDGDGEMNFAEFMSFLGRIYQLQFFGTDAGLFWNKPAKQQPKTGQQNHTPPKVSAHRNITPTSSGFNERPLPQVPGKSPSRHPPFHTSSAPPPLPQKASPGMRPNPAYYK